MQDFGEQVLNDMHFDDGSTGAHDAQPLPGAVPPRDGGRRSTFEAASPAQRIWFFTRAGYCGPPGSAAYEGSQLPRRRDDRLEPLLRPGLADPRHAQPRDRRRLRLQHRHRRLLRLRARPRDHQGAVHPLGASGRRSRRTSACTARSARERTRRGATTRETVRIYKRLSRLHLRARPLILRLWRRAQRDRRTADPPAVAGLPRRRDGGASRTSSGCSAATCSSPRS